jgi:site-specific recombinase XerD
MIHRQNWLDVRSYLRYMTDVRQNAPETVARARAHLRHVLEWADATPLPGAATLSPTLPAYLVSRRLSPSSIKKGLEAARHYFLFAREHWHSRYRRVPSAWIPLLVPPRGARLESHLSIHQFYTLEQVRQLTAVSVETLRQARAQVAAAMLFLSGMRADAFASLPVSCVDLERREIRQLPELGVRTKNRKAALTYLLEIPDLLAVVEHWDRRVRDLPPASLWYSPLTSDGMTLLPSAIAHIGRGDLIERDLRIICGLANLPYLSPHKLRHGHVVHALKQAHNMAELKAISQNVMHASVTITDQVYGRLVSDDVRTIIGGLGHKSQLPEGTLAEILELLKQAG